jgi:hypothetical protein
MLAQVFFLLMFSTLLTIVAVPIITGLSEFFNNAIPILFRGWPPGTEVTLDTDENSDESEDDEQKN